MKEEDLDKYLDSLIIDGLIKESEQDNADFENAMRTMSDDTFYDIILGLNPVDELEKNTASSHLCFNADMSLCFNKIETGDEDEDEQEEDENKTVKASSWNESRIIKPQWKAQPAADRASYSIKSADITPDTEVVLCASESTPDLEETEHVSLWRKVRPWIISAACAAAVITAVVIPVNNHINARLCDNALYVSEAYMNQENLYIPTQQMPLAKVESELPALVQCYDAYRQQNVASDDLQRAGWELALAYLRLHKRSDAVKVLTDLAEQFPDTTFGTQCTTLVKILE